MMMTSATIYCLTNVYRNLSIVTQPYRQSRIAVYCLTSLRNTISVNEAGFCEPMSDAAYTNVRDELNSSK